MIEKNNDEMVEDVINTLPYHKQEEKLLPIGDDRAIEDKTEKEPEQRSLNILNDLLENEFKFLDNLKDKKHISIPGKDSAFQTVDMIGLHNILESSPGELKDETDHGICLSQSNLTF